MSDLVPNDSISVTTLDQMDGECHRGKIMKLYCNQEPQNKQLFTLNEAIDFAARFFMPLVKPW